MSLPEKPKILIVDDIEVNLILLETVLRREVADIYKATSGEAALKLAEELDLALVILDVSMPGMNGYEVAERLREEGRNRLTPIIFVSAVLYDQQSISKGYQSGAVDYLTKPFQNEILLSKVRVFLKLHQQTRELQSRTKALNDSLTRYQKAEQTIVFKYQFERAVSLASARFSGVFDPESSVQYMLLDLEKLSGASSSFYTGFSSDRPIPSTAGGAESPESCINSHEAEFIRQALIENRETCPVMICFEGLTGSWLRPGVIPGEPGSSGMNVAIPVNLSDELSGAIILKECNELFHWDKQDICALGVFGTLTGNALERAKTRAALQASEARYRSYIENAPVGILVTDAAGIISEANPAAEQIFGTGRSNLTGQELNNILNPENMAAGFAESLSLLSDEGSQSEFFFNTGQGSKIISAESTRLPDQGFLVFCTDITTAREMEKHLIHTERMVGIGEMATGIAHEINQPLNTISFGIDNLMHAINSGQAGNDYINEKARKIFEGIHRMRSIIDHVRTFSRSNDDYIPTRFSANESVQNALTLISEQLKNRGISVETELAADEEVQATGNTFKIEQVILNLLSNARDAVEERHQAGEIEYRPAIRITSGRDGSKIFVLVSDNGNGIGAEHLNHITTPFYTTKGPGKGTGLGLAISYGIVKEHKGSLSFSSTPGTGTTVRLELPGIMARNEDNTL